MSFLRLVHPALYRASQFLAALKAHLPVWVGGVRGELGSEDEAFVKTILPTTQQQQLFKRMLPNDQRHAIAVARTLQQAGYSQAPLQQAALLHDVAKSIGQPIIHRVMIVLLEAFWPAALAWLAGWTAGAQTGELATVGRNVTLLYSCSWWRRPFVVHAHHPVIGAMWAKETGCDPTTVMLILRHQDKLDDEPSQDKMLAALQWADDLN
jgi:hypothetical protein